MIVLYDRLQYFEPFCSTYPNFYFPISSFKPWTATIRLASVICHICFGIFTKLMPIIQQGNSYHCMTEYYVTSLCNRSRVQRFRVQGKSEPLIREFWYHTSSNLRILRHCDMKLRNLIWRQPRSLFVFLGMYISDSINNHEPLNPEPVNVYFFLLGYLQEGI